MWAGLVTWSMKRGDLTTWILTHFNVFYVGEDGNSVTGQKWPLVGLYGVLSTWTNIVTWFAWESN
jgi:hypothetical protein